MDLKSLFDSAVGEPPPSTVDLDAVMVRGRRAAALRRVSPMVGAAAAAALVVFAAVVLPARGQPDDGVAAGPPSPSPSPEHVRPGCRVLEPPTPDQASRTRQRLTTAVRELVEQRLVSGERLTTSPAARDSEGNAYGPLEFFQMTQPGTAGASTGYSSCEHDPYTYLAYANVVLHGLAGSVSVEVSRSRPPTSPCEDGGRRVPNCRVDAGPNGSWTHERTTSDGGVRTTAVVNDNNTTVQVTSTNTVHLGTPDPPPNLPIPPLDRNQLLEITLDSRLELP